MIKKIKIWIKYKWFTSKVTSRESTYNVDYVKEFVKLHGREKFIEMESNHLKQITDYILSL